MKMSVQYKRLTRGLFSLLKLHYLERLNYSGMDGFHLKRDLAKWNSSLESAVRAQEEL